MAFFAIESSTGEDYITSVSCLPHRGDGYVYIRISDLHTLCELGLDKVQTRDLLSALKDAAEEMEWI